MEIDSLRKGRDLMIRKTGTHGMGLAVAILLLAVLSIFTLTLGSLGIYHLRHVKSFYFFNAARYAALAGINECASRLYGNTGWTAGFSNQRLSSADGEYDVTFNRADERYSVNNFEGATAVPGFGGISVPPGFAHIIAKGTVNGCVQVIAATIRKPIPGPDWKYAIFADKGLNFRGGGSIKSFDSSEGAFPYRVEDEQGDIGTNGTAADTVSFSGTSDIYGNVFIGPEGNVSIAIDPPGGGSHIKAGTAQVLSSIQQLPKMSDFVLTQNLGSRSYSGGGDYGTLPPGRYDDLTIAGKGTLHLTTGNYSFRKISQASTSTIQIDAPETNEAVRIYVRGTTDPDDIDLDVSGGGLQNGSYKPTKCFIYGGTWTTSVRFTGSSQGYWALYAPLADAEQTGTQDVWGGVVCKRYVQWGSGSVKYDRSLARVRDTGSGLFPQIVSLYHLDPGR
jgi:hypothetical protein